MNNFKGVNNMNNLILFDDVKCNPLQYEFKEKKLQPDFLYTKELLKIVEMDKIPFSIESLKMDIMQLIFVDNDCLKIKIFNNKHSLGWDIEGKLYETSVLFQQVLKEKDLYINRNLNIDFPKKVKENDIPKKFRDRLQNFKKIFDNYESDFFVFEAKKSPDPILVMQLNKNFNRNFLLGVWE